MEIDTASLLVTKTTAVGIRPHAVALASSTGVTYAAIKGVETNIISVAGESQWEKFIGEFVADTNNIELQFYAGSVLPGADIDDVVLEDTGTVFLKPEEPLAVLQGERAMGEWKLEAIDTRTGATNPAVIDDWQLILDFAAPARLAESLSTGQTYPNSINNASILANTNYYTPGIITGGETEWFYYDVCADATKVTVQLAVPSGDSISMQLLADRSGFPTGDPSRDDYTIQTADPGNSVKLELTTSSPAAAPLRPGKRLFFAVRGASFPDAGKTNESFTLNITSDGSCPSPAALPLITGQKLSALAFAASTGDPGTVYQTTTSAASSVELDANAPLILFASNGNPPSESNYQLKQTVANGAATLALPSAGNWYFRVVNNLNATVPYTITVGGSTSGSGIHNVNITGNHLQVAFASVAGTSYAIDTSTDLVNWTTVTTIQATGSETTYTDTAAVTGTARFIRIRPL
ncbi:MAG: hypothetical protein ACXWIU_12160 [Limisphaerales bacterium]